MKSIVSGSSPAYSPVAFGAHSKSAKPEKPCFVYYKGYLLKHEQSYQPLHANHMS